MPDIFLSRPTWVSDDFQAGLDGFTGLLTDLNLTHRTLGATDYPAAAPLDEVIRLMDLCSGAIILGYPQIFITEGTVKNDPIGDGMLLGTEWNHIEAGLAHAKGLPLLIIHHRGVQRGIFDRGTVGRFIYEIDLANPAWPLADNIRGALNNWRQHLQGPEVLQANQPEPGQVAVGNFLPSEHEVEILRLLADGDRVSLTSVAIARRLEQPLQRVEYYLERLSEADFIYFQMIIGQEPEYELDQNGRGYLIENDLL